MSAVKHVVAEQRDRKRAKASGKRTRTNETRVEWRGYVNYSLTNADKAGFPAYSQDTERLWDDLEGVLERGYKFSAYHDDKSGAYVGALYCQRADDPNAGYTLTMRGSSAGIALARVIYVHMRVLEGRWPVESDRQYDDDQW